ncbi:MAG: 50S ribosomal protein L31 [Phycisphaerae bacterium]
MKAGIHPKYMDCTVTCGCGHTWKTRSTIPEIKIEICSACHPFYTGSEKIVDSMGRVDRFTKKYGGDYFATTKQRMEASRAKARRRTRL